ncbi:GNAT family N-acetyltransferase [Bacillus tianshenii]|nr:GNAT family N-acetyltransferase [Bacillus tianshenii]
MLSVISINEAKKWDEIVKSFRNFDVYYLSGYTKAFHIHGDGEPLLFYYEDQCIRAINVVMKRDIERDENFLGEIPQRSYFDLVTPYGYGGFLIEGDTSASSLQSLKEAYHSYCRSNGIISEFVRFHPILKNDQNAASLYDVLQVGKTISIDLDCPEQIWNELTGKNRNVIRKAKKLGVEIYWGRNPELFDQFIDLYNATMDKDNADDYYYFGEEFYHSVLEDLKYHSYLFYAMFQGEIIAMSIILACNQQLHYHLSASDREYQSYAATNLLLYEAACWGAENGYTTFHLGGGLGGKEDSLYKFKKAFNKHSANTFSIGRKVFDEQKYTELMGIRSADDEFDLETTFFPQYRAKKPVAKTALKS